MNISYLLILTFFCYQPYLYTKTHEIVIEEAFVTFATSNYFPILKILLDSVKAFSARPIVAYGVNEDIPFSQEEYPCLIKRRLNVDLSKEHIYFQKPKIILNSNIRYGVYVEADDIVNQGVDTLFQWCRNVDQYPLCPLHPQDPDNQQRVMQALGVHQKSMPYVHGHVLFSHSCKRFIKEWYKTCLKYGLGDNYDETVLNVLLWKYNVKEQMPIYDPYFSSIDFYERGINPPWYDSLGQIYYFMFHGCKDPEQASIVLNRLKEIALKTKDVIE